MFTDNSKDEKIMPKQIRKELNIKTDGKIDINHIPYVAEYYNKKFRKNYTYLIADINGQIYDKYTTFAGFLICFCWDFD